MIKFSIEQFLTGFNCRPAASVVAISQLETQIGFLLPDDYKQFLYHTNGGEGSIGQNSYVIFWSVEKLAQMNKSYRISDFAPGLFLFGSDGGGEGYAFDIRTDSKSIVTVPFVGMSLDAIQPLANNFLIFMQKLFDS